MCEHIECICYLKVGENLKENDWEEKSLKSSILGFWEKDFLKDFVF